MTALRSAIVTGGGSGIGAATAAMLVEQGWNVLICGRREEPLRRVADVTGAVPLVADASAPQGVGEVLSAALEWFGVIDGLVLNAGIVRAAPVGDLAEADWNAMVQTNLTGPYLLLRAAIPYLVESRGSIVGVASASALRASAGTPGYNATKAGLAMLIQSVAVDYGPRGVRANVVCPGWTRTEMADMEMREYGDGLGLSDQEAYDLATSFVPAQRPATATEIACAIAWLISDDASYVNAAVLPVDGGTVAVDPGAVSFAQRAPSEFQRG